VGLAVNVNLVVYYAAPLNVMREVVQSKCSDSIHVPTMVLNWLNTSFWVAYGFAQRDFYIMIPNGCGLFLGLCQGCLCLVFPKSGRDKVAQQQEEEAPLPVNDSDYIDSQESLVV
jgi:solute carrier family 50 protein (sugar transporter)